MENHTAVPAIPESAFEHRIDFESHWIDKWIAPNPFIALLYSALHGWSVELTDFTFTTDAKNVGETALIVSIRELRCTIRVGLNHVVFHATNPDWDIADKLVNLFNAALFAIQEFVSKKILKQESFLAFHISVENGDFRKNTQNLVNLAALGEAKSFGVSVYREDSSILVERSLRYRDGLFVRISRIFDDSTSLANMALRIYQDEIAILKILGIEGAL